MGQMIKKFSDGTYLEYDQGKFDKWCVYLVENDGSRKPPLDVDYFSDLLQLAKIYGSDQLYSSYVSVYDLTTNCITQAGLDETKNASLIYGNDSLLVEKILSILYMAMIAEENKAYTKLGKRIKRLGIYMLLFENATVYDAANFMRGMGWRDIDKLCKDRGF